jgi:hypothetical protein
MKVLGIYRHPIFSNNAIEADRLILEQALSELADSFSNSITIHTLEESETGNIREEYNLVLTMAQSETALANIEASFPEEIVLNSSKAIRNCYRKKMSEKLSQLNIGYVPFQVLQTDLSEKSTLPKTGSYWLKRSDFHAIADEDVCLAEGIEDIFQRLKKFRDRGVKEVILQQHIAGDIYKFYGVKGKLFRPIKVRDLLSNQGKPDFSKMQLNIELAADALGLNIYGGDAIFDQSGKMHFIDLNDWPSFRLCRDDAAKAIAEFSLDRIKNIHTRQPKSPSASISLR